MFAKKPAVPKAPWAIRVLTPDFLIDGYTDTEAHPDSWSFFTHNIGSMPLAMLWITSPRFTPVAAGAGPAPAVPSWVLPYAGHYIAVMPFDDQSLAVMRKNASSQKNSFSALLYAGPYAIRGQLLSSYAKPEDLTMMGGYTSLTVLEAAIEYRLPGAQLTGLKAPVAVVNSRFLHGIGLLAG